MNGKLVTSDGRTLAYKRVGAGPLLVCHCGGPGFPGATLGELGGLSDEHELVILDPRGAGASDRPRGDDGYRLEDYVADLDELRRHLKVDAFDLLGHSHGGFVAMTYAVAHPERVRRLVLVSTAPRFAQKYTDAINVVWDASSDPTVAEARRAREQRLSGGARGRDDFVRLAMLETRLFFAHGIPNARSVVLDDAGHFAWVDAPDEFREEVGRSLAA